MGLWDQWWVCSGEWLGLLWCYGHALRSNGGKLTILVGGLEHQFYFCICWENNPNYSQLTNIQRGGPTTNQKNKKLYFIVIECTSGGVVMPWKWDWSAGMLRDWNDDWDFICISWGMATGMGIMVTYTYRFSGGGFNGYRHCDNLHKLGYNMI